MKDEIVNLIIKLTTWYMGGFIAGYIIIYTLHWIGLI